MAGIPGECQSPDSDPCHTSGARHPQGGHRVAAFVGHANMMHHREPAPNPRCRGRRHPVYNAGVARLDELRHHDPEVRGAAVSALTADDLTNVELFVALLERAGDFEPSGVPGPTESAPIPEEHAAPTPSASEGSEMFVPVAGLAEVALYRIDPPGNALALEAFERILGGDHPSRRFLADTFRRFAWTDDADAVRRLVPGLLRAGAPPYGLLQDRTSAGMTALCDVAMTEPVHWDLLKTVAHHEHGARQILAKLKSAPGSLDSDTLTDVIATTAIVDRPRAVDELVGIAEQRPLALGFAALVDDNHAPRFRQALLDGLPCHGPEANNLYTRLRYLDADSAFPVGLFLARHGRGIDAGRRLGAFADPDFQAWLETFAADESSPKRTQALCLLLRAGRHQQTPELVAQAQHCFTSGGTDPSDAHEVPLLDLVRAQPPLPGLAIWLRELCVARPLLVGQVATALELAHERSLPNTDRGALLGFVGEAVDALAARGPRPPRDAKPIPGHHPERVLSLARRLAAPAELIFRLEALLPPRFK